MPPRWSHLTPSFKGQFLQRPQPCTFIYGEQSLAETMDSDQADVREAKELEAHGIKVAVVPGAGHAMMLDNLDGFVEVLQDAVMVST